MKATPTYCLIDVVPGNWVVLLSGTVHEVQSSPHGWFIEVAGVKVEQREYDPDTTTHGFNTKVKLLKMARKHSSSEHHKEFQTDSEERELFLKTLHDEINQNK